MRRQKSSSQAGYSLVEVLIAMLILAVGILAVSALQIGCIQGNKNSRSMTEATAIAQGKMESLMGLDYDDLDSPGNETEGQYILNWTVTNDVTLDNTKDIEVTVNWEVKGAPKSMGIKSTKARAD